MNNSNNVHVLAVQYDDGVEISVYTSYEAAYAAVQAAADEDEDGEMILEDNGYTENSWYVNGASWSITSCEIRS